MLIRELLADMRSRLSDDGLTAATQAWTDAELLRHVHAQMRSIANDLSDTDTDFYTHEFELFADGATKRHNDVWAYDLPASLHHVIPDGVRRWSDEDGERNYALHREPRHRKAALGRWQVDQDGMLTLFDSEPYDLIVRAAKMPARPFWAALTEDAVDVSRIQLPLYSSIAAGVMVERDAYVGLRLAIASQGAGGDQSVVGEARRCTSSYTVDGTGSLKCCDCGRVARDPTCSTLLHARNCDLTGLPKSRLAGPVTAEESARKKEILRIRGMQAAVARGEAGLLDESDLRSLVERGLVSMSAAMNSDF